MTLTITNSAQTSLPIELDGFTPNCVRDKSLAEIERFELLHGNKKLPLAELFQVRGKPNDARWELLGDWSRVHGIGAGMTAGHIHIKGPAGRHVGSRMQGGEINVDGSAGGFLGAEMRGGLIYVRGNAGDFVGAAFRGSPRGMTGGTILIDGDCGDEAGAGMRGGLIAVGGSAGNFVAHNMLAGTVLVLGPCGANPGAGIRRGTLCLFGATFPALPDSFRFACTSQPTVLALLNRKLARHAFRISEGQCDTYNGDFLAHGRGEILIRHSA